MCLRNIGWFAEFGEGEGQGELHTAGARDIRDTSKREWSPPLFTCLHTGGGLCPHLLLLGLERTEGMVFPLNSISRAIKYSKIPQSLSSRQCETPTFSFPRLDHLEKIYKSPYQWTSLSCSQEQLRHWIIVCSLSQS